MIEASFRSQPGAEPRPYDDWVESRENRSTSDWSMVAGSTLMVFTISPCGELPNPPKTDASSALNE